jgi:biotin-(acetyl-CoA carboxylase) ligase
MSEFLNKLLGGLRENLIGGVSAERILESYRRRNYLAGRPIAIARGDQSIAGVCAGIGDNGAILLQTDEGVVAVASGSVELSDGA